jgi:hypothetical protein
MNKFLLTAFLIANLVASAQLPAPVVYLNFSGAEVKGTVWNTNGPIYALPYQIPQSSKLEILRRVQEDYSIFDINITLDSNEFKSAPLSRRIEVIITPTAWYSKGGGVAYVGSFNWSDYTPAWIFPSRLNNNIRNIAEATSHEIGHVFGLQHQSVYDEACEKISEYNYGKGGDGPTSWAPIMGSSYHSQISTWFIGPSAEGCQFIQNDIELMASQSLLNLLPDDYGDDYSSAYNIEATSGEFGYTGLIGHAGDEDVFKITLLQTTRLKVDALPFRGSADPRGANVHLGMKITNSSLVSSAEYKSYDRISASIDTTLTAGIYYITVTGIGNENMPREFGLGSYSLAGVITYALPVSRLDISGEVNKNQHLLYWKYETDEAISSVTLQYSYDGSRFADLATVDPKVRSYSWTPGMPLVYYRVKLNTLNASGAVYSKIIVLESQQQNDILIVQDAFSGKVGVQLRTPAQYGLYTVSGQVLKKGNLPKGEHYFNFRNYAQGNLLILKVYNSSEIKVQKLTLR